ncbi:gliding motility-associated C-terminal domain-containing protein [Capnocytophaga granulosa]|uniref:T9SS type B sorting domain-containing protein n=1 Tax=Capnocytophaga granulosa TaxID=45242 RepID=UPI0028D0E6D4|nr:gliding motility-associated C-terminal domain-containing protein [Capnocytophaga granulosa]
MIEINKKRIINLLTIVVLLLSYSGLWAQTCESMPEPVTYTRIGSATSKLVKEYADVKGVRVTRTLKAGTRTIDKIKYSNEDTSTPTETYCNINRQAKYGGKNYPFMDSNKVVQIIYEFSKPVADVEVFLAAFGYSGTPQQVGKDQIDDVKFAVNNGSLTLHPRSTCTPNAIEVVNGNEVRSKKRVTTDAKVGITSTEPFTQLTLTYHEPGGTIIGGAGFYVEICLNSVEAFDNSACDGPASIGSNFPATADATAVLNGVEVVRKSGAPLVTGYNSNHCGSNIAYPANLPLLKDSKEVSYEFKVPITSAEIFLYAFGDRDHEGTYDEVEFSVDGGGQIGLVKTYECNQKVANLTGSTLKSLTNRTVTDVAVRVTSTQPFTKITLKDKASTGWGYSVALCPASIYISKQSYNCTPANIGSNFANQTVATTAMNGVTVKRTLGSGVGISGPNSSNHCGGTVNYPAGLPLLLNNKNITYEFSTPVRSAEIFLYYFGDNLHEGTLDRVKFAVDGGGTATLTKVYDCNPGATIISGMEVRSTTKKVTTDTGIRVTSTAPFTKITLTDVNSDGGGYYVVICPNSVKRPSYNSGALCSAMPDPNFVGTNTATLNGIQVTIDRPAGSEKTADYTPLAVACQPKYKRGATLVEKNKVVTYKFSHPVNNVEVWFALMGARGKIPSSADIAKITTNCTTVPTLSIVADCVAGAAINGNKVWADGEKGVDVGVKVTSDKPFTELTITDDNSEALGYFVELCPASVKKQGTGGTDILGITTQLPTTSNLCEGERGTLTAKATLASNFTGGTIRYQWQKSTDSGTSWTDISGASGTALSGANVDYGFTPTTADNSHQYRVKYTYTNAAKLCGDNIIYTDATTIAVRQMASITSLTASPTSLNETGATNIVYTIKGTPGATVTYRLTGDATDKTVNLNGSGEATVPANGQTAKSIFTILKVEKTGLCSRENLHYKAEVDHEGTSCTSYPTPQFAKQNNAKATFNGVEVTRTMEGTPSYYPATTYPSDFCTPTIMEGHPVMNDGALNKITYTFAKPVTKVQVWLSGFGSSAPNNLDEAEFSINCAEANLSLSVTDCNSTAEVNLVTKSGNRITSKSEKYFQAIVQVTADKPFTKLEIKKGTVNGFGGHGYLVELCPTSLNPAKIKVTQNPTEITTCVGATGKRFTARAKIDGVAATESMSYIWQQTETPTVESSWITAVAPSPGGSVKVDASTEAGLTLNAIKASDNGLYYRAAFTFTKCSHTLETVYSEPAKLNVPSASDIITITAPTQGNITTSDCTASTQVSVRAKVTDGYNIKNDGGGNFFGYFLQYKDTDGTWRDHATQKFSNNANNADKKLTINHGQTASGTVFRVRYTVTLTTGCEYTVNSSEFTFTKNLPAEPAIATPQTFCQSENKTVGDLTTLSNIKWYSADSGGNVVLPSTVIPVGTKSYWATITTNGCESTRKEIVVTVDAKPTVPTVQTKTECPATGNYDMKNLVTSIPGHTLKWYAAATGNATTASTVDRNKTAKTTYEKWVALATSQGCESDRVKVTYIVDITTQPTIAAPAANLAVNCADSAATTDAAVNAWAATATATVGCGTGTITNDYATAKPADLCSVGEFEVTFTVRDAFGNQKTAKKKITVNRLIANNDTATVARSTGGDINVLSNDSVNGAPATTANAVVSIVNDNGTGATVTSDGKVHIPGGTLAPGTYNITYKICDKNNPSLCGAPATIALTVNNSTIQANNDDPETLTFATSVAYAKNADSSTFNVLANDRLSGVAPNTTQVDIIPVTTATGVSIESDGRIKVAASTPAGVYTLTYKIKEKNTTNESAVATVTVKVKNTLTATPASLQTPITPSVNATTPKVVGDVLNQTALNGNKPNTSQVGITVTQQATPPVAGDPVPSINTTTGKVEIPSGVKPGTYTIKYKLCDKVTPQTCTGEVTLPITVAAGNTIVAQNDDFSTNKVEHSSSEEVVKNGSNPVNVLANDKLDTRTGLDTNVVTITQTSPASAVNIDTATGQIKVAANTPAGVYEVKYKITEKGQTTASGEATAKVVVTNKVELTPATIPATVNTPDDGNDKTIANVLDKAKINGNTPTITNATVEVVTPAPAGPGEVVPYVDPATGNVIVPVGTKPGNHQITYKVCDKLPAGQQAAQTCKTATITIPVTANTATSANDDYSSNPVEFSSTATSYVKNGTDDANVLSNDALGSNTTITTSLVDITQTHTSNPGVTIETTTGKVKVAPNTPAGEYTLKYKIAEKGGGPSSAESTVKVVVKNKLTLGSGNVPSSVKPATGNTPDEIGDVLNGTKLNGATPTIGTGANQVTIAVVTPATPQGSNPVPTLDTTTGKVKIPAGVPAGPYTIKYKICDNATGTAQSCKEKTLTINVAANNLTPIADDYSSIKVEKPAANTFVNDGTNDVNVLTNDKLGAREGLDTNVVEITEVYSSNPTNVGIDLATGKVKVGPGATAGEHTIKYTLKEKGQSNVSTPVTVKVTVTNKVEVTPATIPTNPSVDSTTPKEIGNVLNQTTINGSTPSINDVTITATPSAPGSPKKPYIDTTTGKVMIPSGVAPGNHTITYEICDKAPGAANTCKTATVTVNVASNTITPADDDFSAYKVEHPTTQTVVSNGANHVNILTNDKLGSRTGLTKNEVTITQTTPANPHVNIDTTNGEVDVQAGTPAGEYTVKYKITEIGQPASAASAEKTVTVVVTNKLVNNNGNYGGAPSTTTTPADGGNVLDNVRINGATSNPSPSDVTISVDVPATGTTVPYLETSGADKGKIKLPQGTPSGTYTIKYTVCDTATGAAQSCKQATATVVVDANAIIAQNDTDNKDVEFNANTAQNVKGASNNDLNILDNDKLGATTGLNNTQVTIQPTQSEANITIQPDGKVQVAAGKAAGVYELKYKIKDNINPTNISQEATVKVVVKNKVTNDPFPTTPVNPSTDNNTPAERINILDKVKINGNTPSINDVTIEVINDADPQSPGDDVPELDPATGKIKVPAGVKPGAYTIKYKVCDKVTGEANSCVVHEITVNVAGNDITAVADDFSAYKVERSNTDTFVKNGTNKVNVLTNDVLGSRTGLDTDVVTITQTHTTEPKVTIETDGSVKVAANAPAGTHTVKYKITEKGQTTASNEVEVKVVVTNKIELDHTAVISNPVTPSADSTTPKEIGDVLDGTKLNGTKPTIGTGPNQVTVTVTNPATPPVAGDPVPELEEATGKVKIPAGVKPGNYNITYKVCDNATPQTCETTTITVQVQGNTITAEEDDFSAYKVERSSTAGFVKDGTNDLNILTNDKLADRTGLDTNVVTITQTATSDPKVTIDTATGKVKVDADTPVGEYTLKYTITEKGQTTASNEVEVKVVVVNKIELTPNDVVSNPVTPSTDSTTPKQIGDVLDGTKLNGAKPTIGTGPNQVSITVINPATPQVAGDPVPELDTTTGKVKIPAGVKPGDYNITYKVCDNATPQTCQTTTITVKVQGNTIDAVADDFTAHKVERPATATFVNDGTNDVNVLSNDKLGARTGLDISLVTITQTDSTDPKVSIDTTTGKVKVDADAPAGTHTVKYKITEKGQTTVSNEVEVIVVVTNKVVSNDDTYAGKPSTNATPRPIGNVLDNVRFNGATTNPAPNDVTVSVVTPATGTTVPSLITTGTDAGKIVVPQGTPAGDYTIVYKVCDNATGAAQTCKTNTATVKVTGNDIVVNPTPKRVPKTGGSADILDDVTIGGDPATKDNVGISIVDDGGTGATIDPATGKINVPGGLAPGEYTVTYKVCEKGSTTNCQTATIKVVVPAGVQLTPDADATVPKNGGVVDVLGNDTVDGNPATKDNVDISIVDNGGIDGVRIDDTGKIVIPDGATPGEHIIKYKVCEKGTNRCEEGTVKVVVAQEHILANADNYEQQWSATETVAKNERGEEANILANDELASNRSLSTNLVDIEQVEASSDKVSIDTATGKVKIAAGAPVGPYTLKYTIKPKGQATPVSAPAIVTVVVKNKVEVTDDEISGTPSDSDTPNEIGNVTDNIKINGQKPNPSDVTIQVVTPADPKRPGASVPTIDTTTGKITVGKDVPKGDYTIRVKVCDKDTPATCVEKDYKIRVRPNQSLQAIDDEYTLGFTMRTSVTTGGSVLDNDKLADKTKLSTDDVTVDRTLRKAPLVVDNDLVIMNEDGYITVKPGLPEGTYTYYYTIRTKDNSQTAEAKVVIHISKYVAADDTITVERPSKEGEETPSENSVLDNDRFNGEKPEPGAVDITLISVSESADGKIELDTTTGKIKVKPGAPIGEHTLKYRVCPKGSTTGCQEGEAKVTVQPNLTLKELTLDKPINSAVSETHTDSVLNGSTLDGQPISPSDVTMEIVNGGIDGVTINADGQITIPKGAPSGTYTIEYKVKSNAYGVEKIGRVTVTITNDADLEFYNAISTDEGSQNNGFIIKNIDLYPNNNLKIFNRYGVLVYEKDGYTNTDPFKGISTGRATVNKDGKLPQGTYYYVLEYTDGQNQKQQKAGWLYIK